MHTDCLVLMIEDDPDDIYLFKRALRTASAQARCAPRIEIARNGQEAISVLNGLDARRQLPHVVTLDLNMPVMDGIGFLKVVRSTPSLRDLRTIVITTSAEREVHAGAKRAGADEIWVKPQTEAAFVGMAEHVLTFCPC